MTMQEKNTETRETSHQRDPRGVTEREMGREQQIQRERGRYKERYKEKPKESGRSLTGTRSCHFLTPPKMTTATIESRRQ